MRRLFSLLPHSAPENYNDIVTKFLNINQNNFYIEIESK